MDTPLNAQLSPVTAAEGAVIPTRVTAPPGESFVVFLIGARVNRWWLLPAIWGVATAMSRMMRELQDDPESGLLSFEQYGGRTSLTVQYWRSLAHLQRYAHRKDKAHVPAWRRWAQQWGLTGAVGVWHETYVVAPGTYETLYHHMPAFGLGRALPLVAAEGALTTARGRLAAALDDQPGDTAQRDADEPAAAAHAA